MALDLPEIRADFTALPGLEVEPDDGSPLDVQNLPYYSDAESLRLRSLIQARPQRVWRFVARLDGRVVGHSAVNVTTGRLGVGGIFNCGVVPEARNRGIGKAVTAAACRQAHELGCGYALLNASEMGERIYRQLGFISLGWGQTWWMHRRALDAPPPPERSVALADAVGRGDLAALDTMAIGIEPKALDEPLLSGMTLMDLAVKMQQPRAAEWLAGHGATLDLLSAWDLGWKERLGALLVRDPSLLHRRAGDLGATPLHDAVWRNDLELVRALLAADPDLEAKDRQYQSTPLGWARHLGRLEIIPLLEAAAPAPTP
jgi:GNAT superfamily N-acetyltransferase